MTVKLDEWFEFLLVTVLFGGVLVGFWLLSRWWERRWVESLESRSVDRRFLRWQRTFFRGHYPFGHWRQSWSVPYLRFWGKSMRLSIIVMAVLYVAAVVVKLLQRTP